jgi:hypothetical protein
MLMRYLRWMPVAALLPLLVVLMLPRTRWIVKEQLRLQIATNVAARDLLDEFSASWRGANAYRHRCDRLRQAALARSQDAGARIVLVTLGQPGEGWPNRQAIAERLHTLARSRPDQPEVWAAVLRYASSHLRLSRDAEQGFISASQTTLRYGTASSHGLVRKVMHIALADARRGEAADRGNAFFAQMQSVALFGLGRDDDALAALHRAAEMNRWDDYAPVEPEARLRIERDAFGKRDALSEVVTVSSVLLPYLAQTRAGFRLALYMAIRAEEAGDRASGLRIRHDLMRVAATMRARSRMAGGALDAVVLCETAIQSPGGQRDAVRPYKALDAAGIARREAAYDAYLRSNDYLDEARWASRQFAACHDVQAIVSAGRSRSVTAEGAMQPLATWWVWCLVCLSLTLWLTLFGAAAAFIAAKPRGAGVQTAWVVAGVLGLGAVVAVLYANAHTLSTVWLGYEDNAYALSSQLAVFAPVVLATVPVAILLCTTVLRAARRRPARVGIAPALLGSAVVCGVVYATLVLGLSVAEERASADLARMRQHEGRYLASLIGRRWPPAEP